jgi:hypothetical protein
LGILSILKNTHVHTQTNSHTRTYQHTRKYTHNITHIQILSPTKSHIRKHSYTHSQKQAHTSPHLPTHTHTRTHAYTHRDTKHTDTPTHTRTHQHTPHSHMYCTVNISYQTFLPVYEPFFNFSCQFSYEVLDILLLQRRQHTLTLAYTLQSL